MTVASDGAVSVVLLPRDGGTLLKSVVPSHGMPCAHSNKVSLRQKHQDCCEKWLKCVAVVEVIMCASVLNQDLMGERELRPWISTLAHLPKNWKHKISEVYRGQPDPDGDTYCNMITDPSAEQERKSPVLATPARPPAPTFKHAATQHFSELDGLAAQRAR